MNLLSKHRILQEGDEWKTDAGEWKTIPSAEFGLQIMFSKYNNKEIRRPSEPDSGNVTLTPISPKDENVHPKAESDKSPAPSHSGAGTFTPPKPLSDTYGKAKPKPALPTVVSKRAHSRTGEIDRSTEERGAMLKKAEAAGKKAESDAKKSKSKN